MPESIGIFQGKQAKHNKAILRTLYMNGPLTAWGITSKLTDTNKVSLHATLNKSLRHLEKKGYVAKKEKQWILLFKGWIAALMDQSEPKPITEEWLRIAEKAESEYFSPTAHLKDFEQLKTLASLSKKLSDEGVINFDCIKNTTLARLLDSQSHDSFIDKILGERG